MQPMPVEENTLPKLEIIKNGESWVPLEISAVSVSML